MTVHVPLFWWGALNSFRMMWYSGLGCNMESFCNLPWSGCCCMWSRHIGGCTPFFQRGLHKKWFVHTATTISLLPLELELSSIPFTWSMYCFELLANSLPNSIDAASLNLVSSLARGSRLLFICVVIFSLRRRDTLLLEFPISWGGSFNCCQILLLWHCISLWFGLQNCREWCYCI